MSNMTNPAAEQGPDAKPPMHGYVAFFNGQRKELYAPSLYAAKLAAIAAFKPSKKKEHMVSVVLAERADGSAVVHVADF